MCIRDSGELGAADGPALGPPPVSVLPELVDPADLDANDAPNTGDIRRACGTPDSGAGLPVELVIGIGADDLEPARLRVPSGDHVFIGGNARTGRSTALRQVEAAWRLAHPGGRVVHLDRHSPVGAEFTDGCPDRSCDDPPWLFVVDDAERVDDPYGTIARLIAQPGVTFAVAARLAAVRAAYGHWKRDVARGRCGLIMTSTGDVDGELLGATLPRRPPIPPRPGLSWVVDHDGHRLVQVAARMPP